MALKAGWVTTDTEDKDAVWEIEKDKLIIIHDGENEIVRIDPADLLLIAAAVKSVNNEV